MAAQRLLSYTRAILEYDRSGCFRSVRSWNTSVTLSMVQHLLAYKPLRQEKRDHPYEDFHLSYFPLCSAYISRRVPEEPSRGTRCIGQQCSGWMHGGSDRGPRRRRSGPGWVGFPLPPLPYPPALPSASTPPSPLSRSGARSP